MLSYICTNTNTTNASHKFASACLRQTKLHCVFPRGSESSRGTPLVSSNHLERAIHTKASREALPGQNYASSRPDRSGNPASKQHQPVELELQVFPEELQGTAPVVRSQNAIGKVPALGAMGQAFPDTSCVVRGADQRHCLVLPFPRELRDPTCFGERPEEPAVGLHGLHILLGNSPPLEIDQGPLVVGQIAAVGGIVLRRALTAQDEHRVRAVSRIQIRNDVELGLQGRLVAAEDVHRVEGRVFSRLVHAHKSITQGVVHKWPTRDSPERTEQEKPKAEEREGERGEFEVHVGAG